MLRHTVVALSVMLAVVLGGVLVTDPPTRPAPVPVAVAAPVPEPAACSEEMPCFNPCTMGVNGHYPEDHVLYWVPGPCDLSTPLPYGARFRVTLASLPTGSVACDPGLSPGRLDVAAVGPDGVERSRDGVVVCAPASDPFSGAVALALPDLYRDVARLL